MNRFARLFHRLIQQPYRRRKLLAVRANHIQRHHVALILRQQHLEPPFTDIIPDVEFRFERDPLPGNRQAANHLRIIAHDSAGNLDVMDLPVQAQRPAIERPAAQHVGQRIVPGQIFQRLRFAVFAGATGREINEASSLSP